jgi:hypothetical protein
VDFGSGEWDSGPVTRGRPLALFLLALGFGLGHGAPAPAAESITLAPPADAIAGTPFALTVSTTSDSASTTQLRVFVRPDDGRPCEASAAAVHAALPTAVEVFSAHRPATPVAVTVPGQALVGGLRVCAFVELVPAPQTTLSAQQLVVAVRAPLATVQLQLETASPFYGQTFSVRAQGSTEAASGNLVTRAQRGPCTAPDVAEVDSVLLTAGPYDESSDVTIDPDARVQPDRVCAWLYGAGGMLLATAEQPLSLRYDGTLVVTAKRFIKVRLKHRQRALWAFEIKGRTTSGKVVFMRARIVKGGSCVAVMSKRKGASFDFQCLLKRTPRRPLVVEVGYTTGLEIERSAGRVTIALPKRPRH